MNITVFGCGYVGLTTAVGFADMGHKVLGIEKNTAKLQQLKNGQVPFFEPGLQELFTQQIEAGRLSFSDENVAGMEHGEIIFCAVGTPLTKDGKADTTAVYEVAETFTKHQKPDQILINKSTVPVGEHQKLQSLISQKTANKKAEIHLLFIPEFLREGSAVQDFFHPDRIVVGYDEAKDKDLKTLVRQLYKTHLEGNTPLIFCSYTSAELIKYASNAYLSTRVSFINEMANFCEKSGASIEEVSLGIGLDKRIGTDFLAAGIGFGGSCLPKDLHALIQQGQDQQFDFHLLQAVEKINQTQPLVIFKKLKQHFNSSLKGKTIAVWGLSYKPNTDDMRDAPSIKVIEKLLTEGVKLQVFDPVARENAQKIFEASFVTDATSQINLDRLRYASSLYEAAASADALVILTEWHEFRNPDYELLKRTMRGHTLIDGRNILNPQEARKNSFAYFGVGRS